MGHAVGGWSSKFDPPNNNIIKSKTSFFVSVGPAVAAIRPAVVSDVIQVLQKVLCDSRFEDAIRFLKSLRNSTDCDETEIGRMLVKQAETEKNRISSSLIEVRKCMIVKIE